MILKFIITFTILQTLVINVNSSRFYVDEGSDIKTAHINLNDPNHQSLLQNNFNLSADEVRRIRIHSEQKAIGESSISIDENDRFKALKDDRKEVIRNKIFDIRDKISPPEELTHEMAAYPSCNQNNESQWMNENNVTVKFSTSFFERNERNLYLDTAVLRLFKLNPNKTTSTTTRNADNNDCEDVPMDSQIRVTVSTIQTHRRNRKDRKKRICNTIMLNVSHHGWVEIDVKRAINIWEKFDRQTRNTNQNNSNDSKPVMIGWLTIEVHDEEERPLKPGLYFEPPKCSQAYPHPALPWNAYRIYYSTPADMEKVPKSPRLDVKLVDLRGINTMLKRSNSALNFTPFNNLNSPASPVSPASPDCNHNHTHHHAHHNENVEFNHHSNNVNPEQNEFYADKRLNATAKQRISEFLFSTMTAIAPYLSSAQYDNNSSSLSSSSPSLSKSSSESKRHIKRNISTQQIEQHLQLQQQQQHQHQQFKHNRNHHNRNRNKSRRHLKQKQQHNQQRSSNTNINENAFKSNDSTSQNTSTTSNTSILIGKLRELSK